MPSRKVLKKVPALVFGVQAGIIACLWLWYAVAGGEGAGGSISFAVFGSILALGGGAVIAFTIAKLLGAAAPDTAPGGEPLLPGIETDKTSRMARDMLASMAGGMALLGRDGTVKLINLRGTEILRCTRESIISRRLPERFGAAAAFLDAEHSAYREIEIRTPDGTVIPLGFCSSYYHGPRGERDGVIVVFQDLTGMKSVQEELINRERFAAMGRIVAGVAHEIRNPLFGISSIGQIFERELTDPAHRELIRALLAETDRLKHLVEGLLIYGRPMKLRLEECDLRGLWEWVIATHRPEMENKGIDLAGDYQVRYPNARLDPFQIRQVFLNLMRNALEATPSGGTISLNLLIEDRYIIFKVSDSGTGIPPEHLDRVFDLFFTTKHKGTGMGLAISKKIVEDHGGEIAIASAVGTGTTVTVKLPYQGAQEQHEPSGTKS